MTPFCINEFDSKFFTWEPKCNPLFIIIVINVEQIFNLIICLLTLITYFIIFSELFKKVNLLNIKKLNFFIKIIYKKRII